jgi:hypothetical protein
MSDVFRDKDLAPVVDTKSFMLAHTSRCLRDTPVNQKIGLYDKVLKDHQVICDLASAIGLKFADVQDVLQSPVNPTSADLEALPDGPTTGWIGYLLTLYKRGCRKRHYGGSGTDAQDAGASRFNAYDNLTRLPKYVGEAIEDGFVITHKGVFCWTESIPPPALQPQARLLFHALEATFSYLFWVMRTPNGGDWGIAHLCLWNRFLFEYDGLCSHPALTEGVGGNFDLSAAELEDLAALKARRRKDKKERARSKIKADAHFVCTLCNTICSNQKELDIHNECSKHWKKMADLKLEKFRFKCHTCVYGTDRKSSFTTHMNTDRHARQCATEEAVLTEMAIKVYDDAVIEAYELAEAEVEFAVDNHHSDMGIEEYDLFRE